jgi:hypothetical protein
MSHMYKANPREWGGVPIKIEQRNRWIEECIRRLEMHPETEATYTSSGNSAVIVFKNQMNTGPHTYEVFDCIVKRTDILKLNEDGYIVDFYKSQEP